MNQPERRPQDIEVDVAAWSGRRRFSLLAPLLLAVLVIGFFILWFRASAVAHEAEIRAQGLEAEIKKAKNLRDIEGERFHLAWDAIDEINRQLREASPPGDALTSDVRGRLIAASRGFYERIASDEPAADRTSLSEQARACWQLAETYRLTGDRASAAVAYRQALALYEDLTVRYPELAAAHQNLARAYFSIGNFYDSIGDLKEAEQAFSEAAALNRRLTAAHPKNTAYVKDLAGNHHHLARLYRRTGNRKQAETNYQAALALRRKLASEYPDDRENRHAIGVNYAHLGRLYRESGQPQEAAAAYEDGLAVFRSLTETCPQITEYGRQLADTQADLGALYRDLSRWEEAIAANRAAVEVRRHLLEAHAENVSDVAQFAAACDKLGTVLMESNQPAAAIASYNEAIDRLQPAVSASPGEVEARHTLSDAYAHRAAALIKQNQNMAAARDLNRAVEVDCGKSRCQIRAERAASLARSGEYGHALIVADELAKCADPSAETRFHLATVYAIASAAVDRDPRYPSVERLRLSQEYADRAMAFLAASASEHSAMTVAQLEALQGGADFDALRGRLEFTELVERVRPVAIKDAR
jgi:tetratricopeptide (TPR) repeat protein